MKEEGKPNFKFCHSRNCCHLRQTKQRQQQFVHIKGRA